MKLGFGVLWLAVVVASCLRPGEQRAERDREVGEAHAERLGVRVHDGLAAVRGITDDRLVLWASAPHWRFTLQSEGDREIVLEVQNAMPDAVLEGRGALRVEALSSGLPTRKRFRISLPSGTTDLEFGPPQATQPGPFRFALLSDVQEAIDEVQDIFDALDAEPDVDFLLGAGDLTRQGTHEQLQRFQRELESLDIPYYTTLGNHELGESPSLYQDYFGRGSFQFDYRGVTFTLLDSASAGLDPLVYEWLEDWLQRAKDRVHVVTMHIAPLDPIGVRNGAFASRAEAAKLLGMLAEGRVDLTLYGHIHSYYEFDNAGIRAYISGGGGAIPERFDEVGRHFLVFDADPNAGIGAPRLVRVKPEGP